MRLRCALCGKPTSPFVMVGREPVGPKCAARAGLTPKKAPKGSRLKFMGRAQARPAGTQNLDLFDDAGEVA